MTQEIHQKLQRIHRHAQGLRELMASLHAHAPQGAEGRDSTEQVRVSIGADGLPTAIQVTRGWQGQLGPQAVGLAVLEAFTTAVAAGMRAWSDALNQTSWESRVLELDAQAAHPGTGCDPPAFSSPSATGLSGNRDPQEIAEDVLRAADRLRKQATNEQIGVGTDQTGNVSIRLSRAGLQACSVQTVWASRQDGRALTAALDAALRTARAEFDSRARPPRPDSFDQLVGQALATLQSIADATREDAR